MSDRIPSNYRNRLAPWCIIRLLPKMQRIVVARFRNRNDAEAHLNALKRMNSTLDYAIVFDPPDQELDMETPNFLEEGENFSREASD